MIRKQCISPFSATAAKLLPVSIAANTATENMINRQSIFIPIQPKHDPTVKNAVYLVTDRITNISVLSISGTNISVNAAARLEIKLAVRQTGRLCVNIDCFFECTKRKISSATTADTPAAVTIDGKIYGC